MSKQLNISDGRSLTFFIFKSQSCFFLMPLLDWALWVFTCHQNNEIVFTVFNTLHQIDSYTSVRTKNSCGTSEEMYSINYTVSNDIVSDVTFQWRNVTCYLLTVDYCRHAHSFQCLNTTTQFKLIVFIVREWVELIKSTHSFWWLANVTRLSSFSGLFFLFVKAIFQLHELG